MTKAYACDPEHPALGTRGSFCWWAEPETGYHVSDDVWQIKRDMRCPDGDGADIPTPKKSTRIGSRRPLSYTVLNDRNDLYGGYAGTDDLNRTLFDSSEVGSYKDVERSIGLFYFLWHGEHGDSGIFNLQKIIDEVGIEAGGNVSCGKYGPAGAMHWFSEPLYGYYYANDAWVMRKHAELLTMANIDFLFFDVTNAFPYCGENMSGECGTIKQGERRYYYKCHGRKNLRNGCKQQPYRKEILEKFVLDSIIAELKKPGKMD